MATSTGNNVPYDSLVAQELRAASELLRLLCREQDALRGDDPQALGAVVADKLRCMDSLEQASRRRAAARAALPAGTGDAHTDLGDELLQLARNCREQNQANGRLLEARRRHVEQVLAILRGQSPAGATGYGPAGEAVSDGPGQSLAKA